MHVLSLSTRLSAVKWKDRFYLVRIIMFASVASLVTDVIGES